MYKKIFLSCSVFLALLCPKKIHGSKEWLEFCGELFNRQDLKKAAQDQGYCILDDVEILDNLKKKFNINAPGKRKMNLLKVLNELDIADNEDFQKSLHAIKKKYSPLNAFYKKKIVYNEALQWFFLSHILIKVMGIFHDYNNVYSINNENKLYFENHLLNIELNNINYNKKTFNHKLNNFFKKNIHILSQCLHPKEYRFLLEQNSLDLKYSTKIHLVNGFFPFEKPYFYSGSPQDKKWFNHISYMAFCIIENLEHALHYLHNTPNHKRNTLGLFEFLGQIDNLLHKEKFLNAIRFTIANPRANGHFGHFPWENFSVENIAQKFIFNKQKIEQYGKDIVTNYFYIHFVNIIKNINNIPEETSLTTYFFEDFSFLSPINLYKNHQTKIALLQLSNINHLSNYRQHYIDKNIYIMNLFFLHFAINERQNKHFNVGEKLFKNIGIFIEILKYIDSRAPEDFLNIDNPYGRYKEFLYLYNEDNGLPLMLRKFINRDMTIRKNIINFEIYNKFIKNYNFLFRPFFMMNHESFFDTQI